MGDCHCIWSHSTMACAAPSGNWTQVSHVTGGYTDHYTNRAKMATAVHHRVWWSPCHSQRFLSIYQLNKRFVHSYTWSEQFRGQAYRFHSSWAGLQISQSMQSFIALKLVKEWRQPAFILLTLLVFFVFSRRGPSWFAFEWSDSCTETSFP